MFDSLSLFQVAKARYGEPPLVEQTSNEVDPEQLLVVDLQREQLVKENLELKEQLQEMMKNSGSASSLIFDKFKSAIKLFEDIESGFLTNTKRMVSFFLLMCNMRLHEHFPGQPSNSVAVQAA